jgi:tetratricopeptide (TPR) repeat protein
MKQQMKQQQLCATVSVGHACQPKAAVFPIVLSVWCLILPFRAGSDPVKPVKPSQKGVERIGPSTPSTSSSGAKPQPNRTGDSASGKKPGDTVEAIGSNAFEVPGLSGTLMSASAIKAPLFVEQMLRGKLTPEKALEEGLITSEDVFYILNEYVDDWGNFKGQKNEKLRQSLASVLVKSVPKAIEEAKLPPRTALWAADYLRSVNDAQAIKLFEAVLDKLKSPSKTSNVSPILVQAHHGLAKYHKQNGDLSQAIQIYLNGEKYYAAPAWLADNTLEAARLYTDMREEEKALELYSKISAYGDSYMGGLALYDQASRLMWKGRHETARNLLLKPTDRKDLGAEVAFMFQLTLLGDSYYKTGQFDLARKYSEEALAQHKKLDKKVTNPAHVGYLAQQVEAAQNTLAAIEKWKKQPFEVDRSVIRIQVRGSEKPVDQWITVKSLKTTALTVRPGNPMIEAQLADDGQGDSVNGYIFRDIRVKLMPEKVEQLFETDLFISTPDVPGFEMTVHVYVDAIKSIK